jgi:hypothetical protein
MRGLRFIIEEICMPLPCHDEHTTALPRQQQWSRSCQQRYASHSLTAIWQLFAHGEHSAVMCYNKSWAAKSASHACHGF